MTKSISSNSADPNAMLKELASALKDKGQIEKTGSAWGDGFVKVAFQSVRTGDKLLSRFNRQHLKIRRQAAFNEISALIQTSKVPNGEQLLANIRTVMDQKGKLKGKDVAQQITQFISDDAGRTSRG